MKRWNEIMSPSYAPEQPIMLAIKLLTWKKKKCLEMNKKKLNWNMLFKTDDNLYVDLMALRKLIRVELWTIWNNKQRLFKVNDCIPPEVHVTVPSSMHIF